MQPLQIVLTFSSYIVSFTFCPICWPVRPQPSANEETCPVVAALTFLGLSPGDKRAGFGPWCRSGPGWGTARLPAPVWQRRDRQQQWERRGKELVPRGAITAHRQI